MAAPPERLIDWFEAALNGLEAFLLSADVFRPALGSLTHPHQDLSLGGLLLAADALGAEALPLTSGRRGEALRLLRRWNHERSRRPAAVAAKAAAEAPHRANLWRAYVADLADSPAEAARYSHEVRHRVILSRLAEILEGDRRADRPPDVEPADRGLRALFLPGPFVWDDYLSPVYPEDAYWYLYGRPAP